ncbi:nose resistant to fluoxetine protein 6 [Anabrus simplex]|uniref:nose resistant to fluoxetine protein 6 n=1 Tax=Anabrus simplex TaxID=316456 RepID=UPI0035A2BAA5
MAGRAFLVLLAVCLVQAEQSWWLDTVNRTNVCYQNNNHTVCDVRLPSKCDHCQQDDGISREERTIVRAMFSTLPPFVPISSRTNNSRCLQHSERFLNELEQLSVWALVMHDSSAKLPSGILNGNLNQYGDYDRCVKVSSPDGDVQGKYCLAALKADISITAPPKVQLLHKFIRSHNVFFSEMDDPGHRVPHFSSMNWALCVPASCTAEDVQAALEDTLQPYTEGTGISFQIKVRPSMCQVKQSWIPPLSFVIAGAVFLGIILLAAFATLLDFNRDSKQNAVMSVSEQYAHAFSLRRNVTTLFSVKRAADDIECVHGIRFLNAYMLLLSHKSMALFYNPYIDRTEMGLYVGELWTTLARGASLYTDPFIMMSGLLTSYSFIKTLDREGKLNIAKEYTSRIMRLLPNLAALIAFCTFILPWTGTGPQWNQVITHHADICKQNAWRNMLFIHNYYGFENMCLTHTHHVGIDTQLFLASPLLVALLWRWPRGGLLSLLGIAGVSTFLRYYITYYMNLSPYVYYGASISQLFRTADYSYILPSHRATVYIMGIILGYALLRLGRGFKIKESQIALGWAFAAVLFFISFLLPATMGQRSYIYDPIDAANYAAYTPIAWCLCFAWVILLCYIGCGGILGKILSWSGFLVSTRLSYAIYLTQFPIFFYNVGTTRTVNSYSFLLLFNFFETVIIVVASVVLTLFIDLPFQNVRNLMLKKKK